MINSKGIYSMVTTFFLVAAIIFIVIGLVYFNYMVTSQEGMVFEGVEVYEKANDIKDNILQCYGRLTLERVGDTDVAKKCTAKFMDGTKPSVKGFSIEVFRFLSCKPAATQLGNMQECKQRFVYYLNVDEKYMGCLGRMTICS